MTDIPVGGFAVEESGWSRFKKQIGAGFRAIGRGLKTAATAVWNGLVKTSQALLRGTAKVLGLTGTSIGWIVGVVITGAIMLAVTVMWLAITALIGLVWLLRWLYDGFDTYFIGVFRYLARSDRTKTFKQVNVLRTSSITTGLTAWYFALLGLRSRLENYGGPATEGDIETLVAEAEAAGHPLSEGDIEVVTKANEMARATIVDPAIEEALRAKEEQLIAEHPDLADLSHDINQNPISIAMSKFVGEDEQGVNHTRVEFDFTPFLTIGNGKNTLVLDALAWLRDDADDKAERSYWAGRIEALNHFENERNLDEFKARQKWAMVAKHIEKVRYAEYRVTEAKTGYFDMVHELRAKQTEPRTRGPKR